MKLIAACKTMSGIKVALGVCVFAMSIQCAAQGFAALVSPPRVTTGIKPAQTTRQVLEITQVGPTPGKFRIYTNDWRLNPSGSVEFFDDIQPGSCRPWVALERREITVPGNGKSRFRFEITPPVDAPASECRFAIMVEGLDTSTVSPGGLSFPVSGRIGVIVYAGMADTAPALDIISRDVSKDVAKTPLLQVRNSGSAHGRIEGFLSGTDAKGLKLEFTPSSMPILPGETRSIALTANVEGSQEASPVSYPITIKGVLEWGGKRSPFEHTFQAP